MRSATAIIFIACLALSRAQTATVTAYDSYNTCQGATVSSGATINKLYSLPSSTFDTSTGDAECKEITSGSAYIKLDVSTTPITLKTFSNSACSTASPASENEVQASGTITLDTCISQNPDNTIATVATTDAPAFRLTQIGADSYKLYAYNTLAYCTAASGTAVPSTANTNNKLYTLGSTTELDASTTGTCTEVSSGGVAVKLVGSTTTAAASFKSYDSLANCNSDTTGVDIAGTSVTLTYGTCLLQAYGNTDVTTAGQSPYFKLTYTAADEDDEDDTTFAMNKSVGFAALVALLIAALF